ncbi:MAG: hypothetical protein ABEH78_02035 [Haloferacaceae archaeon]
MITNREIRSERLLEDALGEVTESALANDIGAETVASTLRDRAEAVEGERGDPRDGSTGQ